jgi:serine/threonine protein kinase
MNIASGVAKGLMYLHDHGMVYRCMRSSDILLGDADGYYYPKLSQYGLTELGQHDLDEHITKVFAFAGTLAPETTMTGKLSASSDVYTFGIVLLEIITGRRTFDTQATGKDRSLLAWVNLLPLVLLLI